MELCEFCGNPTDEGYFYICDDLGNLIKCNHEFQQRRVETNTEASEIPIDTHID